MPRNTYYIALFSASLLLACGGKSFEVEPNRGGADPGGSNQGGSNPKAGSAHGGSGTAGTGYGGAFPGGTGQGGSAGESCESFDDHAPTYVPVEIHNATSAPIHLGQDMVDCGVAPLFGVKNEAGVAVGAGGDCRGTCRDLRTHGPVGCPAICAYPSVLTLQPGEAFHTNWDARFTAQVMLPAQCLPNDDYGNSCVQARAIQPGQYTFSSEAGSSVDCTVSGSEAVCSECLATGSGGCMTPGALIAGERVAATTTVLLDSAFGIYGSLPPPAPAYPGDADTSGAAPSYPIEKAVLIVFGP